VRPEGLGKFKKKSPHRVSNPRPSEIKLGSILKDPVRKYRRTYISGALALKLLEIKLFYVRSGEEILKFKK
jgi:hypothetical protein